MTRITFGFLGLFLLLYGFQTVTNFRFEWMLPITGFAALIAGALILLGLATGRTP